MALLVSLSIVLAVSVVGVGVVQVGIGDARRIAHELRRLEAQAAAEDALDRAALWLRLNASRIRGVGPGDWMEPGQERWRLCDPGVPRVPCAAGDVGEHESFDQRWSTYGPLPDLFAPTDSAALRSTVYYVARTEGPDEATPGWSTLHVIAEGRSRDGTGRARLRRSFQLRPLLRRLPEAAVVVSGTASVVGDVAVESPDGVPPQAVGSGGDALAALFGPAGTDVLRGAADTHEDCSALDATSKGLLWIRGDCVLPTAGTIGSVEAPALVVVESGSVRIEGPLEFFGILVLRSATGSATRLLQAQGPSTLHGALVADRDFELAAEGALSIRYEPAALQGLLQLAGALSEVPGSWTDHR